MEPRTLCMPGRCPTSKPHPRAYILAASLVARAWAIVCSLAPWFLRSAMKIILWFETVSYWVTLASPGGIHCVDQSSPEVTVLRAKVCITLAWSSLSFMPSWRTMLAVNCWVNFLNPGYITEDRKWCCGAVRGSRVFVGNLCFHLLVGSSHVLFPLPCQGLS